MQLIGTFASAIGRHQFCIEGQGTLYKTVASLRKGPWGDWYVLAFVTPLQMRYLG